MRYEIISCYIISFFNKNASPLSKGSVGLAKELKLFDLHQVLRRAARNRPKALLQMIPLATSYLKYHTKNCEHRSLRPSTNQRSNGRNKRNDMTALADSPLLAIGARSRIPFGWPQGGGEEDKPSGVQVSVAIGRQRTRRGPLARNSGHSHRCRLAGGRLWTGKEDGLDLFFRQEEDGKSGRRAGERRRWRCHRLAAWRVSEFLDRHEPPWRLHPSNMSSSIRRRSEVRDKLLSIKCDFASSVQVKDLDSRDDKCNSRLLLN